MVLLGIVSIAVMGILGLLYIQGIAWVSVRIFYYVELANAIAFVIGFFILVPLAIFRTTRMISAMGLLFASCVFGVVVWIYGFVVTYELWGLLGVFTGLMFCFVGVVPLGMIAAGLHGLWNVVGE